MCATCDGPFEAKHARATYCSDRCRKRASRAGGRPRGVGAGKAAAEPSTASEPVVGDVAEATQRELAAVGRLDTALGRAAMLAARRLDASSTADTGASVAALLREHRAALAGALSVADPLDELRGGVFRVIAGGKA